MIATAGAAQVRMAAETAGLTVVATEAGTDFAGDATERLMLALAQEPSKQMLLELSAGFDPNQLRLQTEVAQYFAEAAKRLRNPRPDCYISLSGVPLSFGKFAWPFHGSTSGADTFIVHGEIRLEDGSESVLHSKISAALTQTFRDVVAAMEQPFAEGFVYNAIRKTLDQGQLELVKSGNRQPVPVTTRYYSAKQNRFIFNDTNEAQRSEFLQAKAYWLSGVLGGGAPVWLADPRDAQYLNTTADDLKASLKVLAANGVVRMEADGEFGSTTEVLQQRQAEFEVDLQDALAFIKPSFNEDMRGGHTNM
jgi:hypothetical protein